MLMLANDCIQIEVFILCHNMYYYGKLTSGSLDQNYIALFNSILFLSETSQNFIFIFIFFSGNV